MFKKMLLACTILSSISLGSLAAELKQAEAPKYDLVKMKKQYERPKDIPFPKENQYSDIKYELGKSLFFDPRLSGTEVMTCGTCHNPSLSFGDGQAKGIGFQHKALGRKTPTILNLAWDNLFFWDGRAESLEEQALGPIASFDEMHGNHDTMVVRLSAIPGYVEMFKKAFPEDGGKISKENVAKAIATFERKIVSNDAPFDKWIKGDEKAISEDAKAGFIIYNTKANCSKCHSGWNFSDNSFADIGYGNDDIGRGKLLPNIKAMQYAFKTVGLRDIDRRAPYMHQGSLKTLEEVVEHYNIGGDYKRESLSADIVPLHLTEKEKAQLVTFMKTLTSGTPDITFPILPR